MQEGTPRPARVLIADEISGIVGTIEHLDPFGSEVEPCGMARDPLNLIEEARRLSPDIVLLAAGLAGEDLPALLGELERVAPSSRPLLTGVGRSTSLPLPAPPSLPVGAGGAELMAAIRRLRPAQALPAPQEPIPPLSGERRRRAGPDQGEVFLVFAGKGGVGKSILATNLAVALRLRRGLRVALMDLDLQFGDVALMLGYEDHGSRSIEVLAHHGELVDQDLLSQVLVPGPAGLHALLAPETPELAELITTPTLRAILREMRRAHDIVIIDGPARLAEETLEVIDIADHILVVTSFSLTAVKDTRIMLKLLKSLGVDRDRVSIVLNQTRARSTLLTHEVEERLRFRVRTQLPFEHRIVDDAIDSGLPFVLSEPDAAISQRIHDLADFLESEAAPPPSVLAEAGPTPAHPFRRRFGIGRRELAGAG